jgi:hypothetical protein
MTKRRTAMKKVCIFIGGVVTGAILVVVVSMLIAGGNSTYKGITLFEKEGECISENSFKVFQVLDSGEALANEVKQGYLIPTGLTVLFLNEDGLSYYDDQVIKIPSGKCAKQIGIFKYSAKSGMEKTVPIVGIRNK